MSKKLSWLFAMLAAFALVAAACGSDTVDEAVEDAVDAGQDAVEDAADDAGDAMEDAADAADDAMEELSMPGEGVSVTAARANWSTGYFQAAVYAALLTELGFDVSDPAASEFPPSNGYTAMAQGEIDFWVNSWYPGHLSWHQNELPDGTLVGDNLTIVGEELMGSGLEGVLVTKSVADEYGITSMQQINDTPELVELFDQDGDGKADLFGCPEDWTCDDIMNDMISFNGWDNIAQVKAGYDGMIAESVNRANAGDPVMQYTWSPSGYLTQLIPGDNTLWLSMGGEDKILDGSTNEAFDFRGGNPAMLGDTCTEDPCWIGWDAADIQVTANNEFLAANPAAEALFEVVVLSVIDVADQNVKYTNGEDTEDDVKRHAAEWIADNRDLVDSWLDTARAAA
jgi:glycine betaine/proline transport system substrate-binding protein